MVLPILSMNFVTFVTLVIMLRLSGCASFNLPFWHLVTLTPRNPCARALLGHFSYGYILLQGRALQQKFWGSRIVKISTRVLQVLIFFAKIINDIVAFFCNLLFMGTL